MRLSPATTRRFFAPFAAFSAGALVVAAPFNAGATPIEHGTVQAVPVSAPAPAAQPEPAAQPTTAQPASAAAPTTAQPAPAAAPSTTTTTPPPPLPVNAHLFGALVAASTQVGTPYRYGGTTPSGFDCSGFVLWSMAHAGISMPRTSRAQKAAAMPITEDQLEPGDLVFFGSPVHHVGIYVGGGNMIHSPSSGKSVTFDPIHRNGMSATSFGRIVWDRGFTGGL